MKTKNLSNKAFLLALALFFLVPITVVASEGHGEKEVTHTEESIDVQVETTSEHIETGGMMEEPQHMETEEHDEADDHHDETMPLEMKTMMNPYEYNAENTMAGMEIYAQYCVTCHGESGNGEGPATASLVEKPADLTRPDMMNAHSDGELYWKISEGVGDLMPAWEDALTEKQRWQVVDYIRTFTNSAPTGMETRASESVGSGLSLVYPVVALLLAGGVFAYRLRNNKN